MIYLSLVRCSLCGLRWWRRSADEHCSKCFPADEDAAA